ncbi:MAG TPA: cytochrome c3 family protein [Candidatus Binatia bacterium]
MIHCDDCGGGDLNRYDLFARRVLPIGAGAILLTVLAVGWVTQPDRFVRGYAPEQPIPYSHRLHAGTMKIPCQYCHTGVSRARHAGIPAVETCMNCHRVTKTDSPAIQKLTAIYESGRPLEWKRIHALPDHVYFDHRPHVNGGIACQTCHGEIQTMEVVYQQMSMRMGNCLGCHRDAHEALPPDSKIERGAENCNACHR